MRLHGGHNFMKHAALWWQEGVIYQIYPRSLMDSNGDGIGDIAGIMEKVDYLQDLGVDAIWLSPLYPSPDVDFGYDVSHYTDIDPKFGSLEEFDRLVKTAEKSGVHIIMDLVLNHSSDQHAWFMQSRVSRNNPYKDWYIWQDAKPDGKPPNNWLSVFGGSGWEWNDDRQQFYYHMFTKEQPDLNWRNPQVRRNIMDVLKFWLDRGVKGFRLDVFNVYFKDKLLRDNPQQSFGLRPFDRQQHIYDCNRSELMDLLAEMRSILDSYQDAYMVGETFLSTPHKAASYCGDEMLHQAFNFTFLECGWQAQRFSRAVENWESMLGASNWPNYVLNNHDVIRSATRYGIGEDDERLKLAAVMLLTLRGTPFMYYGEEIGMRNIRLTRSQVMDPVGKKYWPFHKGRDGYRSPMQWDASLNSGFSTGKPWLPLHKNYHSRNVAEQSQNASSLLSCYRDLLSLRRQHAVLRQGSITIMDGMPGGVFAYERRLTNQTIIVLLNFMKVRRQIPLSRNGKNWQLIFSTKGVNTDISTESVWLAADEGLVLQEIDA